jgi:acetyl-CoA carboxylase carboxyl transferase subunit beta
VAWLNREKAPLAKGQRTDTPDGLWERCTKCSEIILKRDFAANQNVCPKCNHHFHLSARDRIRHFLDPNSFEEHDAELCSSDPLGFVDAKAYKQRLQDMHRRTGQYDAYFAGRGLLQGQPIQLGVFDFQFMGGSMGSVVGERFVRGVETAVEQKVPVLCLTATGGARMLEGLLSLMQMAKTNAALTRLAKKGLPYVSVLTDPTMGGVSAGFAFMGDIVIAEPKALIGFAGPRVIESTVRVTLPEGFQRAEFLQQKGAVDFICDRRELRKTVAHALAMLQRQPVDAVD